MESLNSHPSADHAIVWEGKHLRVKVCGTWEYAERCTSSTGVVIVGITSEANLLLTEQYRVPMGKNVIELPAGLAGDEHHHGEEFIEAAKRELREETGYVAAHWHRLAGGPPSAGLSNETAVFFRATSLRKIGSGGGHGNEKIQVHEVPLKRVAEWLVEQEQNGLAVDPKIYAGLYLSSL
jgi:ADP-ribose pyrophosphatase